MRVRSKLGKRIVGPLRAATLLLLVLAVLIIGYRGQASEPGVTPNFVVPDPGSISVGIVVSGVSSPITSMQVKLTALPPRVRMTWICCSWPRMARTIWNSCQMRALPLPSAR